MPTTTAHAAIASVPLALVAAPLAGQTHVLETSGLVERFNGSFSGAGAFPFAGLTEGDAMDFRFEFDVSAEPAFFNGGRAVYQTNGSGSWLTLGGSTVAFDRVEIATGPFGSGGGGLSFNGYVDGIGFAAGVNLQGPTAPSTDLPTSLDLADFTWIREAFADADSNDLLLPIVFGTLESATIVPAPGAIALLGAGVFAAARRRR